ncbi:glucosyltransferase domain-containing protein [Yersinia kristensenii]|uniref:glucosyltransferase domain-containing protein n=1 Tax=Yersinia kristensenii TaxID=28152 RepID=UPI0015620AD2|nr:glucosyltransferase domain-containing protein [Yersinia kristensenii]QKJ17458.1 glucosyltransferase domain-containing protein [Yersinia kristensenii]
MEEKYLFDNGRKAIAIITALFSLPIMLSGILYQDDILRSANGEAYWGALGRPLSDVVVMGLGFGSDFVVNLFPLTLILATTLLAASSIILYNRFAIKKDITTGIVFSLFSLSPFFLQNLSYQFDSFPMMLGVFLAVLPYSLSLEKLNIKLKVFLSSLFIIMSLCLYQATVNIFIAICALEILSIIHRTNNGKVAFKTSMIRALSLFIALVIYMKVIAPLYLSKAVKSELILNANNPLESLQVNINKFISILNSLDNQQFFIGWSLLLILSCVALISIIVKVINSNHSKAKKNHLGVISSTICSGSNIFYSRAFYIC